MMTTYITSLMENMPEETRTGGCQDVDLLVEGGAFNGAYLIGAYYFLKEMERRRYMRVRRISSCSVGAFCSMVYLLDRLDLFEDIYVQFVDIFRKTGTLHIYDELFDHLHKMLDVDAYKKVSGMLYITYHNVKTRKQVVRSTYTSNTDMFNVIKRSAFIPFVVDKTLGLDNKYMDGINPYFFRKPRPNCRTLYLNLVNLSKLDIITQTLTIRNEENSLRRILVGVLDAHSFFSTHVPTSMCCYMDNMPLIVSVQLRVKHILMVISVFLLSMLMYISSYISDAMRSTVLYKVCIAVFNETYQVVIRHYCC
jgi:hypothetical protein